MERGGTYFLQIWNFGFIRQNSRLAGFENTTCGCKNFWYYSFLIKNHNIDSYMSGTPNHSQGGESTNQIHFGKVSIWRHEQCENLLFSRNWELTKYESNIRGFFVVANLLFPDEAKTSQISEWSAGRCWQLPSPASWDYIGSRQVQVE